MRAFILALILCGVLAIQSITVTTVYPIYPESPLKISAQVVIQTPTEFEDNTAQEWVNIAEFIRRTEAKTIILSWSGIGGYVTLGEHLIRAIQEARASGKKVILYIKGPNYSMHALVACYVDEVVNDKNYFLMFHLDGYDHNGVYYRSAPEDSTIKSDLEHCKSEGVLTETDIKYLYAGYEVYKNNDKTWYKIDPRPIEK